MSENATPNPSRPAAPPKKVVSPLVIVLIILGGVGLLGCLVIALLIAILLPALGAARDTARLMADQSNLRQIAVAAIAYASDHDNVMPPHPAMLSQYLWDPGVYDSPIDPNAALIDTTLPDIINEPSYRLGDYVFITIDQSFDQITNPNATVYAYTAKLSDDQDKRSVVFIDGHVETLDDEALKKRLPAEVDMTAHDDY